MRAVPFLVPVLTPVSPARPTWCHNDLMVTYAQAAYKILLGGDYRISPSNNAQTPTTPRSL
jgi:hypothetical protein